MFYDLNIPWSPDDRHLPRTLAFAHEIGYNVVALNHTLSGPLPKDLTCPIPNPFPQTPPKLTILRRVTLVLTDSHANARLAALAKEYDLLAVRPVDEASLKLACGSLDCDIISLDLTQRYPFFFRHKMLGEAVKLGKRVEISYAGGLVGGGEGRRNMISNAQQLVRATRGRGMVLSSGGAGLRGPWDVVNLGVVWGLGQERGVEALGKEARAVVVRAGLKRSGYRGVVDVVHGGEKLVEEVGGEGKGRGKDKAQKDGQIPSQTHKGQKRKADAVEGDNSGEKKLSNRQRKKLAHEARMKEKAEINGTDSRDTTGEKGLSAKEGTEIHG